MEDSLTVGSVIPSSGDAPPMEGPMSGRQLSFAEALAEQVFGTSRRVFGYSRARSASFIINLADAFRLATVFNLPRVVGLAMT